MLRSLFFSIFVFAYISLKASPDLFIDTIDVTFSTYTLCEGDCALLEPTIIRLKEPATYKWDTGESTMSIEVCPSKTMNYYVTITDADGDSIVKFPYVKVVPKDRKSSPRVHSPICTGDKAVFTHPNYGFVGTYNWFGPNGFNSAERELSIDNADPSLNGTYGMYIDYDDGCPSDTSYVNLHVSDDNYIQTSPKLISRCNTICDFSQFVGLSISLSKQYSYGQQPHYLDVNNTISPTNIQWLSFVAQEGDYTIDISIDQCEDITQGAIIGLYSDRNFSELISSTNSCSMQGLSIESMALIPGETYYVYMDGCGGNICDFSISMTGISASSYCNDYMPMELVTDWVISAGSFGGFSSDWARYAGDTILAGKEYRYYEPYPNAPNYIYLRENKLDRLVYEYSNGVEQLLYNFNLKVGDSWSPPMTSNTYTVSKIDTFPSLIGPLRRWHFQHSFSAGFTYTECIGGRLLQYYIPLIYSDPVYGSSCFYSGCTPITYSNNCENPKVTESRDSIYVPLCEGEEYHGYENTEELLLENIGVNGCLEYHHIFLQKLKKDSININRTICEGESYMGFDSNGVYIVNGSNIDGCDSTTNLTLTVLQSEFKVDSTYICKGDSILAFNDYVLEEGVYSDTIYHPNGCVDSVRILNVYYLPEDSPSCIVYVDNVEHNSVKLSPNPAFESLTIEASKSISAIRIMDLSGQVVLKEDWFNSTPNKTLNLKKLTPGLYVIEIHLRDTIERKMFIKQ